MRPFRGSALALLACAFFAVAPAARGESNPKVVALVGGDPEGVLPHLRAELISSGFDVVVLPVPTFPPSEADVLRLAHREHAVAGLAVDGAGREIGVWILDPNTGKTTFREDTIVLPERADADSVVTIRVVETLRAALAHAATESAPAAPVAHKETAAGPVSVRKPGPLSLSLRGGASISPGGIGVNTVLGLSLQWAVAARWQLSVDALMTPLRTDVQASEGEASVLSYLLGASLSAVITPRDAAVRIGTGAGFWVSVITMSGAAQAPYVGRDTEVVSVVPHIDLTARAPMTAHVGLGAGVSGGLSIPEVAIEFGDRQVATWGRPMLLGYLAIDVLLD